MNPIVSFGLERTDMSKNHEGMEVGVWDGFFSPSYFYEAFKRSSFIYELLHIFIT